jgi:3-ketosteroid 9alpha-monooxygenase subunit B
MTGDRSFHPIPVAEVVIETADAHSLVLAVPPELRPRFAYRPGQFLTVRIRHGATTAARCYSLCSAPQTDERLAITVKRVPDGRVSNWICDHVTAGDVLDVMAPAGGFTPDSLDDDLVLVAGGSGITPVLSIVKAVLAGGRGRAALVYANRDDDSVIFADELRRVRARHGDRFELHHWLDSTHGPPTVEAMRAILDGYADREAFVCGPAPYQRLVREVLRNLGLPEHRVHIEHFDPPEPAPEPAVASGDDERVAATAEVFLNGQTHRLAWPAGRRLLDVLIDAGLNPPYSCRQGSCGACACRVVHGAVDLVHNEVLEDEDFAEGYTLACQALPRTDRVEISYS